MSELSLKTHYSVAELLSFKLSSLPSAHKNVLEKAKRENWIAQKRKSKGGGLEYELISMPEAVQTEIRSRFAVAVVESKPKKLPAVKADVDLANLTTKQREIADARMALIQYVLELEGSMSRIKAVTYLCNLAKEGNLPSHLNQLVDIANAKKSASRTLSVRTLNQWVIDYCKAENAEQRLKLLAPQVRQEVKPEEIWWLTSFLGVYRQKNGICLSEAYRAFETEWVERYSENPTLLGALPSLSKVQRAMAKLPLYVKEYGRRTGSHYKTLLSYVKRDWSALRANDVWIGDGHAMKLKVAHPIHGKPFTPELTLIIDGAGRKVVGWSMALAENAFAVADALRHAISTHGVPAIYYSDNGGGEKNKFLDAEITGMLPRLGSQTLYDKGWLGSKAELIGDDNGELLGKRLTPHRLKTIYHTNMRSSAMAGKYQAMMANADNRPYWQYSVINDNRTRPAHSALNGKIYRYDDPFWNYFYPPNGWNCRCTVIALDERTMTRQNLQASKSTPEQFVEIEQLVGKEKRKAVGFKLGQNTTFTADAGFGYNVGKSHLANLGKTILDKGVGTDPLISSLAINHAFANPKLIKEITDDFANKVAIIKANIEQGIAKPTGEVWHIGALVPTVIKKLKTENIELQSGIISVSDREIYHLFRTNKAKRQHGDKVVDKRLPEAFIADLPKYLWSPKAVIQDLQQKAPTLLYLYDSPVGKVVIKLNYQLKTSKTETIRTNLVTSGEIVLDETTLRSKNYKLLWGYL